MSRTGGPPARPRCTLGQMIAEPMDKDAVKRDGWQQHQILVIALDDPELSMFERELLKTIGDKRYGKPRR